MLLLRLRLLRCELLQEQLSWESTTVVGVAVAVRASEVAQGLHDRLRFISPATPETRRFSTTTTPTSLYLFLPDTAHHHTRTTPLIARLHFVHLSPDPTRVLKLPTRCSNISIQIIITVIQPILPSTPSHLHDPKHPRRPTSRSMWTRLTDRPLSDLHDQYMLVEMTRPRLAQGSTRMTLILAAITAAGVTTARERRMDHPDCHRP